MCYITACDLKIQIYSFVSLFFFVLVLYYLHLHVTIIVPLLFSVSSWCHSLVVSFSNMK
jgi:hypothetical protein